MRYFGVLPLGKDDKRSCPLAARVGSKILFASGGNAMPRGGAARVTAVMPRTRWRVDEDALEASGTPNHSRGGEVECNRRLATTVLPARRIGDRGRRKHGVPIVTVGRRGESVRLPELPRVRKNLTRQAYPELDEKALATERAHLLYEQPVHWKDSYYLMEALKSEDDA
ncbi:unnamed protein product [Nippostrongylus brasiliensis]|uniref:Transposase n=1 Tax=Nippostrongylus brasiliensis TaxID=27835 RepID=A0A0N4YL05_NIPBR|nr:unnamed protein product [Nippostrongylus brasiliensis]